MNVLDQRLLAAQASGGVSSNVIKDLAVKMLSKHSLVDNLLDFGAGRGVLAKRIYDEGLAANITCIDCFPRPEGFPPSISWIEADLDCPIPCEDSVFDFVVSTEVIEHLQNPRAAFREFWRVLKPGGFLILTMPNQESLRSILSLIFGRHYAAFLGNSYPAHITALLEMDLERICSETGFNNPSFSYTNSGRIPKLTRFRWPPILRGRLFSDNVALQSRKS